MRHPASRKRKLTTIAAIMFTSLFLFGAGIEDNGFFVVVDYSGALFAVGKDLTGSEYIGEPGGMPPIFGVGVGDFNEDGFDDVVANDGMSGMIYYYENMGGMFMDGIPFAMYFGDLMDVAVEDYNNDGMYDFIFTNNMGTCYLFIGMGMGQFYEVTFAVPGQFAAADAGDFNGDGNMDFVLQSFAASTGDILIYFGDGAGNFPSMTSFTGVTGSYSWGITAGDFDLDGFDDIIASALVGGVLTQFYLYRGLGDGNFDSAEIIFELPGFEYTPMDNYDFNQDGAMDIVFAACNERAAYVLYGVGDGSFIPADANPILIPADQTLTGIATAPCRSAVQPAPGPEPENTPPDVTVTFILPSGEVVEITGEEPVTIECETGDDGFSEVTLDASGCQDPDGDPLSFYWEVDSLPGWSSTEMIAAVQLMVGFHQAMLTVSDGLDEMSLSFGIIVNDTTAPTLEVTILPDLLDPTGEMVQVVPNIVSYDNTEFPTVVELLSITCNQESDGDILITEDGAIFLRAEVEAGTVEPRVYSLNYKATDQAGNFVITTVGVTVMIPEPEPEPDPDQGKRGHAYGHDKTGHAYAYAYGHYKTGKKRGHDKHGKKHGK